MILRALPLTFLLLAACGASDPDVTQSPPAVADSASAMADGAPAVSSELTPAYLDGSWCYSHHIVGGERSDEMMTYIFSTDGSLLYQVNSTTPVENPGTYTIDNGHLKISPTLRFFDFTVDTIEPDAMVLKGMGQSFWRRGACSD